MRPFLVVLISGLVTGAVFPQVRISADKARDYVGQPVVVCGVVASTRYAPESTGQPTFLNLGKAYPRQLLTVVIWGQDRIKFPIPPEAEYQKKVICVDGTITESPVGLQVKVEDPSSITIKLDEVPISDGRLAFVFSVILVIFLLFIALFHRQPSPMAILIYRVVLALAAAGIGAVIPGIIDVNIHPAIRASGAIALFVIVYVVKPADLMAGPKK